MAWLYGSFAPDSNSGGCSGGTDRRYFNRHEPTIPGWVAVWGKDRVFATEPIEDEE